MDIRQTKQDDAMVLSVCGRLDATWAQYLTAEIDDVVRDGHHHLILDMRQISYMSSAGIRVLIASHKQLASVNGSFVIRHPSNAIKRILEMSGLDEFLKSAAPTHADDGRRPERCRETASAVIDVYDTNIANSLQVQVVGDAAGFTGAGQPPTTQAFPADVLSVGIGAFGATPENCSGYLGEYLAVAGAVAYLPPADVAIPDYMLAAKAFVPEMLVRHGLTATGALKGFLRFDHKHQAAGVPFSELVQAAHEITSCSRIATVMVTETAGLVGASLKQVPPPAGDPFAFPAVRDWLSFASEPVFDKRLAIVVGFSQLDADAPSLLPLHRPLSADPQLTGHFHAAALSFAPFPGGVLDLEKTIMHVFENQTLQGVLHLLNDRRPDSGAGESLFRRGAIWMGGMP